MASRWFCSTFCVLNGCHAETIGDAVPFIRHDRKRTNSKRVHPKIVIGLKLLQYILFPLYIGMIILWTIKITTGVEIIPLETLNAIEYTLYRIFALYLLLFMWILIGSRAYCYFCPGGTLLGIIGHMSGQQIATGLTKCTECGICNDACKMSIDIKKAAVQGKPVKTINCVGCGICVDSCPQHNLKYSTWFIRKYRLEKK